MKDLSPLPELLLFLLLFSYTPTAAAQAPGTFIPTGNMTTPRTFPTTTLLLNGKVLIAGGSGLASAELFDPETGTFTPTGNMRTPRSWHSATLLPNGRVLIAGGYVSGGYTATAELYDPSTGIFTATGNMGAGAQIGHTANLLNSGKVLIVRGCADTYRSDEYLAEPQLYDPIAATFNVVGVVSDKIRLQGPWDGPCGPAALLANGKVLIGDELYDPATNTFSLTGQRTNTLGLYGTTATLLTNGKVLLTGGTDDFGDHANAEFYEPSTGKFTVAGNMIHLRAGHTATLLRDGTVLIAGGNYICGFFCAAAAIGTELYDPATGTFTAAADMTSPRRNYTATLLIDGRILITGGADANSGLPTGSAEIYTPPLLVPAQIVTALRFDRTSVVAGSSYSVSVSGSNLTPQTFLDVRFISPGSNTSAAVLNWQKGLAPSHDVPVGTAAGNWTINGVRAHEIETDHTGSFFPVSATITVSP